MNIVIISDYLGDNGGASSVAYLQFKKLKNYCSTYFVCGQSLIDDVSNVYNLDEPDLLSQKNPLLGIRNSKVQIKIRTILSQFDPVETVVHIHSWTKILTSDVFTTIKSLGFPIICTLHDYFLKCPNGAYYDYEKECDCDKKALSLSCLLRNCDSRSYSHKIWRFVRQLYTNYIVQIQKKIDYYIFVSEFQYNLFKDIHTAQSKVIPNIFHKSGDFYDVSENIDIGFIGRLEKEKGPDFVNDACNLSNLVCHFIGAGSMIQELKDKSSRNQFHGWCSRDQIAEISKKFACLVFSSRCYETEGLSVKESLSQGIPVICASKTASSDFITHGVNGFIFEKSSTNDLINKLTDFFRLSKDERKEISKNAYESMKNEEYSEQYYITSIMNLNRKVLNEKK